MRRLELLALFLLLPGSAFSARAAETIFPINYFGFPLDLKCEVKHSGPAAKTFAQLLDKDFQEVENCDAGLARLSEKYRFPKQGYSQALLFWRFAEVFSNAKAGPGLVSFGDAVLGRKPMNRNNKIALIYSLLKRAGFGARIVENRTQYFIMLQVTENFAGVFSPSYENYRLWEPGFSFEGIPKGMLSATLNFPPISSNGGPVTFETLGAVPWTETRKGPEVSFRSLENCPGTWNFSRTRYPAYEEFLSVWPRKREVFARLSSEIFAPFNFSAKFSPAMNPELETFRNDDFGNCIFKWVRKNTPYAEGLENIRNPVDTLLKDRKGDCDELSLVLIAMLREAGMPADHIRIATWPKHMNIGVAPIGPLAADTFLTGESCRFQDEGLEFYIMDPSYLCLKKTPEGASIQVPEDKCALKWGMCSYERLGGVTFKSKKIGAR
jgi:hypothetical protein